MDAFSYKGCISVEEAMKSFLCQGQLRHFLYQLSSGEVLELRNLKAKMRMEEREGQALVSVELSGDARIRKEGENQDQTSGQLLKKLNRQLAESLNQTAKKLQEEPGIDMTNSFIRLGGYSRSLYRQWKQDYEGYGKNLAIEFRADMDFVD